MTDPTILEGWRKKAGRLADWTLDRLVVRADRHGRYRKGGEPYTAGRLDRHILHRHYLGKRAEDVVGLLSTAILEDRSGCVCRWVVWDIDAHEKGVVADPEVNLAYAMVLHRRLRDLGFWPILSESNGAGGYHLRVIFSGPVDSAVAHRFARWLVRDHAEQGVVTIDLFPKQSDIRETKVGCGNWCRLPGLHHTRDFWSRIYEPEVEGWVEGAVAADFLLACSGDSADLIPEEARTYAGPDEPAATEEPPRKNAGPRASRSAATDEDIHWARLALDGLSEDYREDRDKWLKIGMALRELGRPGLGVWREFSMPSPKYRPGCCDEQWATIEPGGDRGVTLSSLFHWFRTIHGRFPWQADVGTNGKVKGDPYRHTPPEKTERMERIGSSEDFSPFFPFFPGGWEDPIEIDTVDVPPFPVDVFPPRLAELCRSAALSMGCPVDFFGVWALGVIGAAVGQSTVLALKHDWEVAANLYAAVLSRSGSAKSPALKLLTAPLWSIHLEGLERGEGEDEASRPRLVTDDATKEALARILHRNPRGIVLIKDELISLVTNLNAYRNGRGDDLQFYMKLNTRSPVAVDRVKDLEKGDPIVVASPCLTIVGGMTPTTLPRLHVDSEDNGWLDRFVFAYPIWTRTRRRWRDIPKVATGLVEEWGRVVRFLHGYSHNERFGAGYEPVRVHFSDDGEDAWAEFFDAHHAETEEESFPDALQGPWSKLEGFAARIALALALARWAYARRDRSTVERGDVEGAARLIAYFKATFRRVFTELGGAVEPNDVRDVIRWLRRDLAGETEFNSSRFTRRFRSIGRHRRHEILARLEERHFVRFRPTPPIPRAKGRPPEVYEINPLLSPTPPEKTEKKEINPEPVTEQDVRASEPHGRNWKEMGEESSEVVGSPRAPAARVARWLLLWLRQGRDEATRIISEGAAIGIGEAELRSALGADPVFRIEESEGKEVWSYEESF